MMTPNLNVTGHLWVGALNRFNFQLKCKKDGIALWKMYWAGLLNHLDPDMVRLILDRVTLGAAHPGGSLWLWHNWRWPWLGARGMCCCRPHASTNACYWLGWSPEGRSNAECSFSLVGSPKEDWSEDTFRGACLQWGGPNWSCGINRTSWFIRKPYICAQCPKVRMRIFCTS